MMATILDGGLGYMTLEEKTLKHFCHVHTYVYEPYGV